MELCTPRAISKLSHLHNHGSCSNQLRWKPTSICLSKQGLQSYKYSSLRSTASDETSSGTAQYIKDEPEVISFDDRKPSEEREFCKSTVKEPQDEPLGVITMEDRSQVEAKEAYDETVQDESSEEDSPSEVQKKIAEVLDQLNLKFDPEDSYSLFLFGGTALAALWLTTAVVGAIDSIPVFPKLMEVVGLGYTVWFSTRFLIFKRNRDELASKIEELKQQVLGSNDD